MIEESIKNFIKQNMHLIESDDWLAFYAEADDYLSSVSISKISEMLLKAGVNPLITIDTVPSGFLFTSHIEKFKLPSNIKIIGESAFEQCKQLTDIAFNNGLAFIRSYAFERCESLGPNIYFPDSLREIGNLAFNRCKSIKALSFGKNVSYLATDCFQFCPIEKIEFRGTVSELETGNKVGEFTQAFGSIDEIICDDGIYKLRNW